MKRTCTNALQASIFKTRELHPIPLKTFNFNWVKTRHLLLLILLVGCSPVLNTKSTPLNNPNRNFTTSFSDTENSIPYYNCDDFANNALSIYSLDYLKSNFSNKNNFTKTPINNIHDTSIIDTIYQFTRSTNSIEYYKGSYASFVTKFEVTDKQYELYGGISVGNNKNDFKKKFNVEEEIGDIVNVGNTYKTAIYSFHFRNNKIHKIRSNLYFD